MSRRSHNPDNVKGLLQHWLDQDEAKRRYNEYKQGEVDFGDHYLDGDEINDLPEPEPLISGILNRHSYAIVRGRDSTFKTFVALDWALCLASGRPWQSRNSKRVKVLYIAGEGAYGLASRKAAWEAKWDTAIDPDWFHVRTSSVNFYTGGRDFVDLLQRVKDERYGLVILDTLRRMSGRADGNGSDMGVVVDNIDLIKQATDDGSVLALAHTGKDDEDTRGFSGIEDDADIVWHIKRKGRDMKIDLQNTKMKDGPDGHNMMLELAPHDNGSLVISAADETVHAASSKYVEHFPLKDGISRAQFQEASELTKSSAHRTIQDLLREGLIRRKHSADKKTHRYVRIEATS